MIDNYDSFVYNLAVYLQELGRDVMIIRNDRVSTELLERICGEERLEGIIISLAEKPADWVEHRERSRAAWQAGYRFWEYVWDIRSSDTYLGKSGEGTRPMHGKVTKN